MSSVVVAQHRVRQVVALAFRALGASKQVVPIGRVKIVHAQPQSESFGQRISRASRPRQFSDLHKALDQYG